MTTPSSELRTFKILTGLLIIAVIVLLAFNIYLVNKSFNPKEITAERINIVERDGSLRMAISNRSSQHPGIVGGKTLPARDRAAGLVFFNDEGDECGGLMYSGDKKGADMVLSVDQYQNDQLMQLQYNQADQDGKPVRNYGLKLWDRSDHFTLENLLTFSDSLKRLNDPIAYEKEIDALKKQGRLGMERLFVGKNKDEEVGLFLKDTQGRTRMRLFINKQNEPVIEILDERGKIIGRK
jgi:hypothetical protein